MGREADDGQETDSVVGSLERMEHCRHLNSPSVTLGRGLEFVRGVSQIPLLIMFYHWPRKTQSHVISHQGMCKPKATMSLYFHPVKMATNKMQAIANAKSVQEKETNTHLCWGDNLNVTTVENQHSVLEKPETREKSQLLPNMPLPSM